MAGQRRTLKAKQRSQQRRDDTWHYSLAEIDSGVSKVGKVTTPHSSSKPTKNSFSADDLLRYDPKLIIKDITKTMVITSILVAFLLGLFVRQQGWLPW